MNPAIRLGATGFALIAVCYGFARFAFGLFLPNIRAELGVSQTLGGIIAGGSFFGYCIAIILSAHLTERYGARLVAVLGGLVATCGLALIALATSPALLAAAVLFAGSSTGLASPPLAAAVARAIRPARQDATNTMINAGTSVGVALSGPVALLFGAEWRMAFAMFAGVGLIVTIAAFLAVPRGGSCEPAVSRRLPKLSSDLGRLMLAAFLMGSASTAIWSFGGELTALTLGWTGRQVGVLWIVIGVAGVFGAFAGTLIRQFGLNVVHVCSLIGLAGGILCVGYSGTTAFLTLSGGLLFGAAYIMLTGVYLLWGVSALPERPATGLTVAFLMIAIGQTAGAPVFGALLEWIDGQAAVIVFSILSMLACASGRQLEGRSAAKN